MEQWRDIAGYNGLYQVSDLGRVRRLAGYRCKTTRLCNYSSDRYGYLIVVLSKEGKSKYKKVHRLVAQAFIPNPLNLPQVNHIGKDATGIITKLDNRPKSLEWSTQQHNENHAVVHGLKAHLKGSMNGAAILNTKQVIEIRKLSGKRTRQSLATQFGVSCTTITQIVQRQRWAHL